MNKAFSLLELIVTMLILSILTLTMWNAAISAHIRTQSSKVFADFSVVQQALNSYYADHSAYPTSTGNILAQKSREVHTIRELTTPVSYLSRVPFSPWYMKKVVIPEVYRKYPTDPQYTSQLNYSYYHLEPPFYDFDFWYLLSNGPVSLGSKSRFLWYNPSNGIKSHGGFYLDSLGVSSAF